MVFPSLTNEFFCTFHWFKSLKLKKVLILLLTIGLFFSSCRRENLGNDHPIVGKWKLEGQAIENFHNYCQKVITMPTELKNLIMEITADGRLIVSLNGETQKLKIIEIVENQVYLDFYKNIYTNKKYTCRVSDRKGSVFIFRFFFDADTSKMIGTYWTPDHQYVSKEFPNYTSLPCYYNYGESDYSIGIAEKYGRFVKI